MDKSRKQMDKSRKTNWTREKSAGSLINEIESAGEILRGSGNSADKSKRRKQIWRHCSQTQFSTWQWQSCRRHQKK